MQAGNTTMRHARQLDSFRALLALVAILAGCAITGSRPASAQAIAVVVNGDPITTIEVEEQMKFLRLTRQPSSRNDAIESLVADRLKLRQANKLGIDATDGDLQLALSRVAAQAKMTPAALTEALQKGKYNIDLVRSHLRAVGAWGAYVKALNKGLSVSEEEVAAALAKDSGRAKDEADYTLQQVVFVVPIKAAASEVEQRLREAQALRNRFQDCSTGLALARALPDVAVKPPITRNAKTLSETTRKLLDQTQKGRLTTPERSATGYEMIAVCGKDDQVDRMTLHDNVQADLLQDRLSGVGDKLYKKLRATAVVERH
jgi:peptidyl-prolyl cis-trans isomerase SurA